MAGRCPDDLEAAFIRDVRAGLTNRELAEKYGRVRRTVRSWKRLLREAGRLEGDAESGDEPGGVQWQEDGNYAEAAAGVNTTIHTLEALLEAVEADLTIWQVKRWMPNVWQVGAKEEHADLRYVDGAATGWIRKQGLRVHNLWQIKAELIRRDLIAIQPVIQPIACPVTIPPVARAGRAAGRSLIIPDIHFGYTWQPPRWRLVEFHDRAALDVAWQIAADVQPDVLEVLGDILDLALWTDKFARDPHFYGTTQPSLLEAHWWLRQLAESCPNAERRIHGGNHEIRMAAATAVHLQEAYELKPADRPNCPPALSIENLLALEALGFQWIGGYPDDATWLGEAMQVQHGHIARSTPFGTVTELLRQGRYNQACGHIHRDELISEARPDANGGMQQITAYSPGCLCHIDGRVPGAHARSNWRQGIGVVEWYEDQVSIHHIPIRNGRAVYQGKVYQARDRVPDLRADLPDWNW
ncbi:MAG: hypothetical protein EHM39_00025 [Chloroflexi bacterium]|nr:MAG: hypothetical protein EHM39_00025 [Chloroflexota bacterium]